MLPYKVRLLLKVSVQKLFGAKPDKMTDEKFNAVLFRIMFGRTPNFNAPTTFSEHVCARKLREEAYDLWPYTDKYEVRKYVEETVGGEYLNENYGIYDKFDDINFEVLPNAFVLRGTHGSGYNIIVKNKKDFDRQKAKVLFDKWLKENYYFKCRERNYYRIKPRITCDKYLESHKFDGLPEIKIFCFNGRAKFLCYNLCKDGKTYTNMYDSDWNYLDVKKGYEHFERIEIPANHKEILRVAETLAKPFDFVRVDLYDVDEKIIFSELTFFTGGGFVPFEPADYDMKFAKYFDELE